jgi:hypothetical protein
MIGSNKEHQQMEVIPFAMTRWDPASKRRFDLGMLAVTPTIKRDIINGLDIKLLIGLHAHGVWGELADEDKLQNDEAVKNGGRIMSR